MLHFAVGLLPLDSGPTEVVGNIPLVVVHHFQAKGIPS